MHTVTSFHSSAVRQDQASAIIADYLALEHVRIVRRLLVTRCGCIALVIAVAGAGFGWLPRFASWFSAGLFLALPTIAWIVELRRGRCLARRLKEVPGAVVHVTQPPAP